MPIHYVSDERGLAFVFPTDDGGTKLVYLAGEPEDHLRRQGASLDGGWQRAAGCCPVCGTSCV
jgi:hypothetical protein